MIPFSVAATDPLLRSWIAKFVPPPPNASARAKAGVKRASDVFASAWSCRTDTLNSTRPTSFSRTIRAGCSGAEPLALNWLGRKTAQLIDSPTCQPWLRAACDVVANSPTASGFGMRPATTPGRSSLKNSPATLATGEMAPRSSCPLALIGAVSGKTKRSTCPTFGSRLSARAIASCWRRGIAPVDVV